MKMKREQRFLAITRHHLAYREEGAGRFVGGLPWLAAGSEDSPPYNPQAKLKAQLPIEYFIIPVTSRPDWDGTNLLFALQEDVDRLVGRSTCYGSAHCVLTIPQLHHNQGSDEISATQLNWRNYQLYKEFVGDRIIEVDSLDALFKAFAYHLPDEPKELDISEEVREMMSKVPKGPLNGVLVVAFDQQIAGALASEELARKGACVIKVERYEGGDNKRSNGTRTPFNNFNAGKFSVAFSDSLEDQQLKAKLLSLADVIVDNRSAAAQKRDSALQNELLNPHRLRPLIFCSISGFGRDSNLRAYDRVIQAESGMADFNGKLIPFPIIDMATGMAASNEIATNLFMRERMNPREAAHTPCIRIDISMISVALGMMSNQIATYVDTGEPENTIVPFDLYNTKDGRISVAVVKNDQFAKFCELIGRPALKNFVTNAQRLENKTLVENEIKSALINNTSEYWLDLFTKNNIPAGPVVSLQEAIAEHGHGLISATTAGGLFVGSPATNNLFPQNPNIGEAPSLNADRAAIGALVSHLSQNPNALPITHEISVSSPDHVFHRDYKFIDPHDVNFSQARSGATWTNGPFFAVKKIGKVTAREAQQFEVIDVIHIDNDTGTRTVSKNVAMDGDMVVTTTFGDQYISPRATFFRNYISGEQSGVFIPNPDLAPRKAVRVNENISFMSPSGNITFIPSGGWLVEGSKGAYGIHPNNIESNYIVAKWTSEHLQKWATLANRNNEAARSA